MPLNKEVWFVAAMDALTQFRATKEPIKNVVKRLATQRRLGPKERARMSEAVFGWLRVEGANQESARALLSARGNSRPSQRQVDEVIVEQWALGETVSEARFPSWFLDRLKKAYGEESDNLVRSLQERAGPTLAVDVRHTDASAVSEALDDLGIPHVVSRHLKDAIRITEGNLRMSKLPQNIAPHVWLMDEASQLAAETTLRAKGRGV
jgi:16S rRNA C967 or C1407 C5-methylase (RsmB/RsmF family)